MEAWEIVPDREALFAAPTPAPKGRQKRDKLVANRLAHAVDRIATAHGMTQEDVIAIYRRGEREGWPRH